MSQANSLMGSVVGVPSNQEQSKENSTPKQIPESAWKQIIELCSFKNFSTLHPEIIYKRFMLFINDINSRSEIFLKSGRPEVPMIVSSIKLILQKSKDNLLKFTPLLLKLLSMEPFITDKNQEFCLKKDDFSYYFALDYTIQRILKTIKTWDVENGRAKASTLILILWKVFPEFGPIFLGRLFEECPYALPYIPTDDHTASKLEGLEHSLSIYMRFQASIMSTKTKIDYYNTKFCWLWFRNAFKLLNNANYTKQNFCFVLREFLTQVQPHLLIDDSKSYFIMLNSLKNIVLPKLESIDPSKHSLEAYLSEFLTKNQLA